MSTIANKISSDSRKFLSGVKSSTTQNDRTLSSAMNLSMRLDGKEIELSQKRRMLNAESFIAPQQITDNFQEGYISGYQIGITQGIKQGIQLGQKSVTSPLEEFFKGLPPAAIAALTAIPALGGLLDFFLPAPSTQPPEQQPPPSTKPPEQQPPPSTKPPGQQPPPSTKPAPPRALTPEELKNYNRAYNNKDNPFAKGQISAAWNKMTPDQKAAFLAHAKSQGHDWSDYGFTVPTQVQPKNSSTSQGLQSQSSQTGNAFKPAFNAFNLENMGTEPPGAQLLVMRQPIVVTKKEMGNVVNNGSQLAVIVSGDQRRSDFINYAQRIT